MSIAKGAAARRPTPRRRPPPTGGAAEHYRALVRDARRKRTSRRLPGVALLLAWALMLGSGGFLTYRVAGDLRLGLSDLRGTLGGAIIEALPPAVQSTLNIERPAATVEADPIIDNLPSFTVASTVLLQGHVPTFALGPDRKVEVSLNGAVVGTVPLDNAGRFAQPLTLREGSNDIVTALLQGTQALATTSATIVFDRTPPALSLVRPKNGDSVDGPDVVVEGRTEPRATVVVNGRTLSPNQDGSFTETFTASAGPLAIEVVVRDQAGNETKTKLQVTVRDKPVTAGASLTVSLDRTKVRPGELVFADVAVLDSGKPRPGERVTLSVGVITIGSSVTDATGRAKIGFAAPTTEGEISVVVLGGGAVGRATLTVAK